jgi:hypothetical protein
LSQVGTRLQPWPGIAVFVVIGLKGDRAVARPNDAPEPALETGTLAWANLEVERSESRVFPVEPDGEFVRAVGIREEPSQVWCLLAVVLVGLYREGAFGGDSGPLRGFEAIPCIPGAEDGCECGRDRDDQ